MSSDQRFFCKDAANDDVTIANTFVYKIFRLFSSISIDLFKTYF